MSGLVSSDSSQASVNEHGKLVGLTVPREIQGTPRSLRPSPNANNYRLSRGQFRVTFRVNDPESDIEPEARASRLMTDLQDKLTMAVTPEGERKRIYIYSITQQRADPVNGEDALVITATFNVLDNPIWIVPALWAMTAVIGTVGSWFLIDKVESFSDTTVGTVVIFTVAALTGFLLYKSL